MSGREAEQRAAVVAEAKTWLHTPFRDQADIKGGGVDCAMLLVRVFVDTGIVPPLDPRPYSPQWHLHRDEEKFLDIVRRLGVEVDRAPIAGDVIVYRIGRCYAHGAIAIDSGNVIHAYYRVRKVTVSPMRDSALRFLPSGKPRPNKIFDVWGAR